MLLSPVKQAVASTRISVLNMLPYLREAGFDPRIVFEPPLAAEEPDLGSLAGRLKEEPVDIVYFQKVHGRTAVALAAELRRRGVKSVYGVCDLVEPEMVRATDATVAVTEYLRSLYPAELRGKIFVVHDGIERPEVRKEEWRSDRGHRRRPLEAVLVTSKTLYEIPALGRVPDFVRLTVVGRYAHEGDWRARMQEAYWAYKGERGVRKKLALVRGLATRRVRRARWHPERVYDVMRGADLAIIPVEKGEKPRRDQPEPGWRVKSENRLTMKMCIGLPVVAGRVPSYEPVITHGQNGFFAETADEWQRVLVELRDPERRREVGAHARASVVEAYSKENQARRLIGVLRSL